MIRFISKHVVFRKNNEGLCLTGTCLSKNEETCASTPSIHFHDVNRNKFSFTVYLNTNLASNTHAIFPF